MVHGYRWEHVVTAVQRLVGHGQPDRYDELLGPRDELVWFRQQRHGDGDGHNALHAGVNHVTADLAVNHRGAEHNSVRVSNGNVTIQLPVVHWCVW